MYAHKKNTLIAHKEVTNDSGENEHFLKGMQS